MPARESRRVRTQPLTVTDASSGAWPARISRALNSLLSIDRELLSGATLSSGPTGHTSRVFAAPIAAGCRFEFDMCGTWIYVIHMTTMIQIRISPHALHRQLKSRAALAGMSLSDYLLSEIRRVAERPTLDELRVRLERRSETTPSVEPAQAVRGERNRQ